MRAVLSNHHLEFFFEVSDVPAIASNTWQRDASKIRMVQPASVRITVWRHDIGAEIQVSVYAAGYRLLKSGALGDRQDIFLPHREEWPAWLTKLATLAVEQYGAYAPPAVWADGSMAVPLD